MYFDTLAIRAAIDPSLERPPLIDLGSQRRPGPGGMTQRALADLVLVVHLLFVVFVLAGGLLALRWRWAPWVHLPAALWGAFIEVSGGLCPLTPLENQLRRAAGSSGYPGGFIEHYLLPLIYPAELTPTLQLVLAGIVVAVNLLVYLAVWRLRRRRHGLGV